MPVLSFRVEGVAHAKDGTKKAVPPNEALHFTGPLVQATLALPDSVQSAAAGKPPQTVQGMALFDTGASHTFVDQKSATNLGLPIVGRGNMTSASHANIQSPMFAGKLIAPSLNLNLEQALGANLASQGLIALIGRDVLRLGILVYNGVDGSFSFAI